MSHRITPRNLAIIATISLFLNAILLQVSAIFILRQNNTQHFLNPEAASLILSFGAALTALLILWSIYAFLSIPPKTTDSEISTP